MSTTPNEKATRVLMALRVSPWGSINRPSGFSLVELLVCCSLIGLLTLICVQGLQGFLPAARVNRALREVIALLEWSRWRAVRLGSVFRVVVSAEDAAVTVFRVTQNDEGEEELVPARRLDLRKDHPGVVFGTADGVVRTSGCKPVDPSGVHLKDHAIRFLPSGTSDRCGSLYLIPERDLPDHPDRMRAVSILLTTGRLQTWTYNPFQKSECPDDGGWQPL
jgi:Tfp pilus assembly protein FimT